MGEKFVYFKIKKTNSFGHVTTVQVQAKVLEDHDTYIVVEYPHEGLERTALMEGQYSESPYLMDFEKQ